ncbi:hypothetical protein HPP92_019362 [Vanilla planifolia]|uniref:C2H2-type domain-containing protein n=1 Tax=Vanilla planifolia TaxID=51239 RepID=A0A835QA56_VANPL|nr:hypothetical protein HPP92_019844 [Vanilla planifolia]KAG0465198.1 hypothetical protein HPP92_019362 [Vanilla planifolia]
MDPTAGNDGALPNAGHGRSYDCKYCKGGFSNAQALGGHMNMHRRERGKPKDIPSGIQCDSLRSGPIAARSPGDPNPWFRHIEDGGSPPAGSSGARRDVAPLIAAAEVDLELRLGP